MAEFVVRKMKIQEMKIAISWADKEGWNPGKYDGECFFNADPNGYFIGIVDGNIVSMISAIKYGLYYGFIGFYIVDKEHRGKGYGIQVWNKAMKYLEGRMIGLDGVPEQVSNYEKAGFILAHRNITYKGKSRKVTLDLDNIVDITLDDFDRIKAYDRMFFPEERNEFLKCWISQEDSFTKALVENGNIKAYGKIRKCKNSYKIGPLFAEDKDLAEKLFSALQNDIPLGSEFSIDIPESNMEALNISKKFEMEYSFETARMYTNGSPNINLNKVFGITSYELG